MLGNDFFKIKVYENVIGLDRLLFEFKSCLEFIYDEPNSPLKARIFTNKKDCKYMHELAVGQRLICIKDLEKHDLTIKGIKFYNRFNKKEVDCILDCI